MCTDKNEMAPLSDNEQTFSRQCWPEPEVYCNSIIPIQTKPDNFKIGELVTEFYSGQDRHTLTDPNPRLAESQLWPTMN